MKASGVSLPDLPIHILYFGSRRLVRRIDRTGQLTASWVIHWNRTRTATLTHAGITWKLGPEHLVLVAPRTAVHETMAIGEEHTYLHFSLGPQFDRVRPQALRIPTRGPLRVLLEQLSSSYRRKDELDRRDWFAAQALVAWVLGSVPASTWPAAQPGPRIREAMEYLHVHYGQPVANRELAERALLSTNAFVRLFSHEAGQPPQRYLMALRVDRAAQLLLHTARSVKEIARDCGFCDRNYFTVIFRRYYGAGPATYRRQNAET